MNIGEIPIVLEIKKKIAEINDRVELKWERAMGISRLGNRRVYFYPFKTEQEKEEQFQEELNKQFGGTVVERQKRLSSDDKYMGHK